MRTWKEIKRFIFGDKVPVPEHIKAVVEKHKKHNEFYQHLFCKIYYQNQYYYAFMYQPSADNFFVTEEGDIPSFEEVCQYSFSDLIWIAHTTDGKVTYIERTGKKHYRSWVTFFMKRVQKLLKGIRKRLQEPLPEEIEEAYQAFLEMVKGHIEKQVIIDRSYERAKEIIEQLFDTKVVTAELNKELNQHVDEMEIQVFLQAYEQYKTGEARKKFLKYVGKQAITKWSLWFPLIELYFHHTRMASETNLKHKQLEIIEKNKAKLPDKQKHIDLDFYPKAEKKIRNPRQETQET